MKLKPCAFRLPQVLLDALDHQATIKTKQTGNPTSRADIVRLALTEWLDKARNP